MAFVGTGAAFHATIQKYAQGSGVIHQLAHFIDRDLFPVIDELARKADFLLQIFFCDVRFTMRHYPDFDRRDLGVGFERWFIEFGNDDSRIKPIVWRLPMRASADASFRADYRSDFGLG